MDGDFYTETYAYREGWILLYKRPNSNNFQCRLRIEGIKGYPKQSRRIQNYKSILNPCLLQSHIGV